MISPVFFFVFIFIFFSISSWLLHTPQHFMRCCFTYHKSSAKGNWGNKQKKEEKIFKFRSLLNCVCWQTKNQPPMILHFEFQFCIFNEIVISQQLDLSSGLFDNFPFFVLFQTFWSIRWSALTAADERR